MGNIICCQVQADSSYGGGWIFRHANYVFQLQENLTALESARDRLIELRSDVQELVDERQEMQALEQVKGWLSRVQNLETEVNQLIRDGQRELNQICLAGCPRNFWTRYRIGKKVAELSGEAGKLTKEKPQGELWKSHPSAISERPCEETVGMFSKLKQVLKSIQQEQAGIVGLYGLGGVGKTTLLTQINNFFTKKHHNVDYVIWSTVSSNVNLEKIQDDIWKKIGFCGEEWKSKDRDEKATSIYNVLSKKKFVLLLDDVWDRLNLITVGVPLQSKKNKIVFTTRSEEVCGEMEADQKIKVECLTPTESWELFQKKVGDDTLNSHPRIPELAQAVTQECCGLPLVLTTIGRAMACKKTTQAWEYAIEVLRSSGSKFPGMRDNVLPLLKYSYDCLPDDIARSCFLYCCLFPEDRNISKTSLIGYWICEGLLDADATENHGYNIIGNLTHACLLKETDDQFYVKMHGVIRDMGLWIARDRRGMQNRFLANAGRRLTEAPEVGRWEEPKRISLVDNQIEELMGSPDCPNLVSLFLDRNPLKTITDGFFKLMPYLKVLSLSDTAITELPQGISNLVSLHYLNLSNTMIKQLPIELKNLVELKYLLLYSMPPCFSIPEQLISSLSKLRAIDIFQGGISDGTTLKDDLLSYENNEALVKELESLKYLHDLGVPIKNEFAFKRLLRSHKLRSCLSSLYLQNFSTASSLNLASLSNVKRLWYLSISGCGLLEDLEIDRAGEGKEITESNYLNSNVCFHSLQIAEIFDCQKLKDLTWLVFAPNLKVLRVERCDQMEEVVSEHKCAGYIVNGESLSPFATLRELFLDDLPLLKSIFWKALPHTCLSTMIVYNCPLLKKLPLNGSGAKGRQIVIYGIKEWWNEVEWEDEATRNAFCFVHVEEE